MLKRETTPLRNGQVIATDPSVQMLSVIGPAGTWRPQRGAGARLLEWLSHGDPSGPELTRGRPAGAFVPAGRGVDRHHLGSPCGSFSSGEARTQRVIRLFHAWVVTQEKGEHLSAPGLPCQSTTERWLRCQKSVPHSSGHRRAESRGSAGRRAGESSRPCACSVCSHGHVGRVSLHVAVFISGHQSDGINSPVTSFSRFHLQ